MRRGHAVFLVVGLAGLVFLATRVEARLVLDGLTRLSTGIVVASVIHAVVLFFDAVVLVLCTAQPMSAPFLWRTFRAYLAGHAINIATPFGLGEITKYTLLAEHVPKAELTAAIVVHNVLSFLVNCLLIAVVGGLAPSVLELEGPLAVTLHAGAILFVLAAVAVPFVLARGPWRWPFTLARAARISGERIARAQRFLDHVAAEVRRWWAGRRRLEAAVLFSCLSRAGSVAEVWAILYYLQVDAHPLVPFLTLVNAQVVTWLTIFVPFQAGTAEGGSYLLFRALGLDPTLGVLLELTKKALRLLFVGIGVTILGVQTFRRLRLPAR
jgi:hypothetical protein